VRADQAEYEELNKQLNLQRHVLKANAVWDLPDLKVTIGAGRAIGLILNDWQVSGILTANSGSRYDIDGLGGTSFYQSNGANVNVTGSPEARGSSHSRGPGGWTGPRHLPVRHVQRVGPPIAHVLRPH
jgi:hypothetical protein